MADHLSDEEQLQLLSNWWKENRVLILSALVIVVGAYFSWQWWKQYQVDYALGAAAVYTDLSETIAGANGQALNEEQKKTAEYLIDQLQNDYPKSLYTANASLLGAKLFVDQNELESAETELALALAFDDVDIQVIANLRLAKVLYAQQKYDQALEVATYEKDDDFASAYAAIRGDILSAQGDVDLARKAYQEALDKLAVGSGIERQLLEIKLSDLPQGGDQS